FSDEDERLAVVLAGVAGVAIENAQLYEESRRNEAEATKREHALELVQEVGSAVVAELDPVRVLRMIAERAHLLVEADACVVALQEDMGHDLVTRVATGEHGESLEGTRIPRDHSLSGLAMRNVEAILVRDTSDDGRINPDLRQVAGAGSVIVAPL